MAWPGIHPCLGVGMRVRIPREPCPPPWDPAHPGSCGGQQRAPGRLHTRRRIHPPCSRTSPHRPRSGTHLCLGGHRERSDLECGHHQDTHSHWDAHSHWDIAFPLTGAADTVGRLGHGEANGTHAGNFLAAAVVTGQVTAVLSTASRWFWNMDMVSTGYPCHPRTTHFPSRSMDPPGMVTVPGRGDKKPQSHPPAGICGMEREEGWAWCPWIRGHLHPLGFMAWRGKGIWHSHISQYLGR